MKRIIIFLYGVLCYVMFITAVLYAMGFLNNTIVPTGVDKGLAQPLAAALLKDVGLIALFGLAHSVMARQRFKTWWTRLIPPEAERSTYVLQSSLLLLLIFWQWQLIPVTIWSVASEYGRLALHVIHWLGWVMVIVVTFLINHFELTGLQQVFYNLRGAEAAPPPFVTPLLYKIVRHPMQLGLIIAFWSTPQMTVGRLVFAMTMTGYILIGLYFEERDLVKRFGAKYEAYRQTTPKLLPLKKLQQT